jgi:hypothetical protein
MPGNQFDHVLFTDDAFEGGQCGRDELQVVLDARIGFAVFHLVCRSVRLGDAFEDAVHLLDDAIAEFRVVSAHGAAQLDLFGDDVLAVATFDGADADD